MLITLLLGAPCPPHTHTIIVGLGESSSQVEHIIPAAMPAELSGSTAIRVVGKFNIVKASLKSGMFLTVAQLKQLCASYQASPQKPGRGKNGNFVKLDWAHAILDKLFGISLGAEERERMLKGICKTAQPKVDVEALDHVANLDAENREAFKDTIKAAAEKLGEVIERQGETRAMRKGNPAYQQEAGEGGEIEPPAAQKKKESELKDKAFKEFSEEKAVLEKEKAQRLYNLTPPWLKEALPGGGTITATFWASYHPVHEYFKVEYPCSAALSAMSTAIFIFEIIPKFLSPCHNLKCGLTTYYLQARWIADRGLLHP